MDEAIAERWRKAVGAGLIIGTPVYGGLPTVEYQSSCEALLIETTKAGAPLGVMRPSGESLVPRGRNYVARNFLQTDFEWLLFIDADIRFTPPAVLVLLESGYSVVGGAYPRKTIEWATVVGAARAGVPQPERFACHYVVNLLPEDQAEGAVTYGKAGCVEVLDMPTGFLLIHRSVFEEIREKVVAREKETLAAIAESSLPDAVKEHLWRELPRLEHVDDAGVGKPCWNFFPTPVAWEGGRWRYLSEDYGFCRLYQSIGGKVHLQPLIKLDHVGRHVYEGCPELVLEGSART